MAGEKTVQVPASRLFRIMAAIERMEKQSEAANMINEEEAARLLGIKPISLRNRVYQGKLDGMFTTSPVNGERFYHRDKIIGL